MIGETLAFVSGAAVVMAWFQREVLAWWAHRIRHGAKGRHRTRP